MENVTVKKATLDFLFCSYLGVSLNEVGSVKEDPDKLNDIAIKCAKRAYRDFNRTLSFNNDDKKAHDDFRVQMCSLIVREINESILTCCNPKDFDSRHSVLCSYICDEAIGQNVLNQRKYPIKIKKCT